MVLGHNLFRGSRPNRRPAARVTFSDLELRTRLDNNDISTPWAVAVADMRQFGVGEVI